MKAPEIIATIGHGSHHDGCVRELVAAGATVLRYNAATATLAETAARIARARTALADEGLGRVPVMVDLPFPRRKHRLRTFAGAEHDVPRGQTFRFVACPELQTAPDHVLVEVPALAEGVAPGEVLVVGDGELAFRVARVLDASRFDAVALTSWYLTDGKSVHLPRRAALPVDGPRYLAASVSALAALQPEYLAFSFVETAEDMLCVIRLLAQAGCHWRPTLVAKLESRRAVGNVDGILVVTDAVMVARGDLAIEAPYEQLGLYQHRIIARARRRDVPVIVATHILETTMTRYVPNRSEIVDLTNLVLAGVWGVLLAKETSAPGNPVYPVTVARRIIDAVVGHAREEAGGRA
ncbi:MAG TPA: pyruvate kinase [Methylomirabilota bacterium]|nr:pyruvate kinase [Methylomirabilota bacterium]